MSDGTDLDIETAVQWPSPPRDEAYSGLPGQIVGALSPHTESDPVALLLQLLVLFGNSIGHGPHFRVEASRHSLNLFGILVGATSKGRKGTSLDRVRNLFRRVEPNWESTQLQSGLSSGEGLIWAVRDPIAESNDEGVPDKRLVVIESEFSSPLRMLRRDGNVLSPTIRQAWDSGHLRILTKNSPAVATDAHISILGHISAEELRGELSTADACNGFGNRFLWVCVRRCQVLPDGGCLEPTEVEPLIDDLAMAVEWGQTNSELTRDSEASALWQSVYRELSEGTVGLIGVQMHSTKHPRLAVSGVLRAALTA